MFHNQHLDVAWFDQASESLFFRLCVAIASESKRIMTLSPGALAQGYQLTNAAREHWNSLRVRLTVGGTRTHMYIQYTGTDNTTTRSRRWCGAGLTSKPSIPESGNLSALA